MTHLVQVGAGSGGMPVLDMLCRDDRIHQVTLIEPDIYKPHNVQRHLFPRYAIGTAVLIYGVAALSLSRLCPSGVAGWATLALSPGWIFFVRR